MPKTKLVEPTKTNKLANPSDMDFRNQDGSYDWKSMAMYYKGLAHLTNTLNVDFKNQDGSCDWKSMAMYYKGVASYSPPKTS